ncbi:MAG: hypothetical protein ABI068_01315 [Ktedonobacterales bacterium]
MTQAPDDLLALIAPGLIWHGEGQTGGRAADGGEVLESRFGPLDAKTQEAFDAADEPKLLLLDKHVTTDSLEQLQALRTAQ